MTIKSTKTNQGAVLLTEIIDASAPDMLLLFDLFLRSLLIGCIPRDVYYRIMGLYYNTFMQRKPQVGIIIRPGHWECFRQALADLIEDAAYVRFILNTCSPDPRQSLNSIHPAPFQKSESGVPPA